MPTRHPILNENLTWHDREKCLKAIDLIGGLFQNNASDLILVRTRAFELKDRIESVDRYIQENTAMVCPNCMKVCCINKHGYYDYIDLIYITALGLTPPGYGDDIDDTAPCQFLSSTGCGIERSLRPFRCNWHFCSELISFMNSGPARPLREFNNSFSELQDVRRDMIERFFGALNRRY